MLTAIKDSFAIGAGCFTLANQVLTGTRVTCSNYLKQIANDQKIVSLI